MLILALDTSGKSLSAALVRDGELIGESTLCIGLKHSATALPLIHDLCDRCGIGYPEIDLYACTVGPGSYTGIRIGISLIKGMAYAAGKPTVGVSTLKTLTAAVPIADPETIIVPLLDARSGRYFCSASCGGQLLLPEGNRQLTELASELTGILQIRPAGFRKILLVGDGVAGHTDLSNWPGADIVRDAGPAFRWPRALKVASLALQCYSADDDFSPFRLEASYISPSQAERLRRPHD